MPVAYCFLFRLWRKDGTWERINAALRTELRRAEGREAELSAVIPDSPSVKTIDVKGERGFDAGKKVKGRKRHILVDTLGLLLLVVVHSAAIQDRDGAKLVLEKARLLFSRLRPIWVDGGYARQLIDWVRGVGGWILEIVKRNPEVQGFQALPRRWAVERRLGWLNRYRHPEKGL